MGRFFRLVERNVPFLFFSLVALHFLFTCLVHNHVSQVSFFYFKRFLCWLVKIMKLNNGGVFLNILVNFTNTVYS